MPVLNLEFDPSRACDGESIDSEIWFGGSFFNINLAEQISYAEISYRISALPISNAFCIDTPRRKFLPRMQSSFRGPQFSEHIRRP